LCNSNTPLDCGFCDSATAAACALGYSCAGCMFSFTCNICCTANTLDEVPWEPSTCAGCRSNVRMRALIYMLSMELYGRALSLPEFPENKDVKGFGLSDDPLYALPLAKRFDYTDTFYDREPYFDMTESHPDQNGTYDFILSSDVFEHVAPPVERAFDEAFRLLKPSGFLCITVPSTPAEVETAEYYPDLHEFGIAELGGERILVNRKRDRALEIHENPEFHGGIGATLVMRLFSQKDLACKLRSCGFSEVIYQAESVESPGIIMAGSWSLPLVARKERYTPLSTALVAEEVEEPEPEAVPENSRAYIQELVDQIAQLREENAVLDHRASTLEQQLRLAANSRWLRFGNRLGFGPRLR